MRSIRTTYHMALGNIFQVILTCVLSTIISLSYITGVYAGKIYFTDSNNSGNAIAKVLRANLDGSDIELLVTPPSLNPRYIALDIMRGKMYWTDIGSVRRANLDGTDVENNLVGGLPGPLGIALDLEADKVYWTDTVENKIQRANLDGSNVEDVVTGLGDPRGLALDISAGKMYWTDTFTDKIQRANFDGSGLEDLVTGQIFAQGIALDIPGGRMYWANDRWIWSARLDGGDVQKLFMSNPTIGIALGLDDRKIYWTNFQDRKIQRANLDGTSMEDLVITGLDTPWGIALDIPHALVVSIDLKPGSQKNTINPRSKGVIPVAILTTDTFDALQVDAESVRFGPDGSTETHGRPHVGDVDGDGDMDLILHFRTQEAGITCGDTEVSLTGETFGGQSITGTDSIQTVGC